MPEVLFDVDLSRCNLNQNLDNCGCQISCPSYDCSTITCRENEYKNELGNCLPIPTIPENCATWNDGCNTCQVRNGVAEICTLMYCFTQNTPYCMNYHIQPKSLNIGDICYRFCEDNSQVSINRRSDCPSNTVCKNPLENTDIMSFDTCNERAWKCQNIAH